MGATFGVEGAVLLNIEEKGRGVVERSEERCLKTQKERKKLNVLLNGW